MLNPSASGKQLSGQIVISITGVIPKAAQQALAAAYKKVQPDVSLVWELPGYNNYVQWLETQLAAGNVRPDIVSGYVPYKRYVDFHAWADKADPYIGAPWNSDLSFKGELDASGQLTMIGTRSVTVPLIYNKNLFAKAGVSAPPQTWDDLVKTCAQLEAKGVTPFSANFPLDAAQWMREVYFDQYHTSWVNTVRAQKGDWNYDPGKDGIFKYDPQDKDIHDKYTFSLQRFYAGIRDKTLRYDTPEVAALIANMAAIFPKYAESDFVLPNDPYPGFLAQKGGMMANTPGALVSLKKDMAKSGAATFDFGYFAMPDMTGSLIQTTHTRAVESFTGDIVSVIDKDPAQTALTMDFVMFWLSRAGYGDYLQGAASDAAWAGPDGPLLIGGVQDPPPYADAFTGLTSRGNAEASYNELFLNWGGGQGNFRTESQQIYLQGLQGKLSPEECASQIQQYVQKNLPGILKVSQLTPADLDNPSRQPGT